MKSCSLCRESVDAESAPILAMGGFGNPRYLCDECASDIECALYERDADKIEESMHRLSKKLKADTDDKVTMEAVGDIFSKAGERAKKIKEGTYDFSEDEADEDAEELVEIPEELQETEEDRALDEKEKAAEKKMDKILNIAWAVFLAIFGAAAVYMLIRRFF